MIYTIRASSESAAHELQRLGWKLAQSRIDHHTAWGLLLAWEGEGEPPMPAGMTMEKSAESP